MSIVKEEVHGAEGWALRLGDVELHVTELGGHLAPVRFRLGDRWVSPYALAPWRPDEVDVTLPPILRVLRGDFFCLPFGASPSYPVVHGETANGTWRPVSASVQELVLQLNCGELGGKVTKRLRLQAEHRAVYQEHVLEGFAGRFNLGHHAILEFPASGGPYPVSVSPFHFGAVKGGDYDNPAIGEYGCLQVGARFSDLRAVPRRDGGVADLGLYPAREGFEDLAMVASVPGPLAWTAAVLDGYVWFALKDPAVLPSTLFWISNGGRHTEPWRGRHRRRLGLEEVCSHFSDGLEISRENGLADAGVPTTLALSPQVPTAIRVVQAVHPVPAGFGRVVDLVPATDRDAVTLRDEHGTEIEVPVAWRWIEGR